MSGTVTLHEGDNRVSLRRLIDQGVRVHSVVCDPPYNLQSITKRFGKKDSAAARTDGNDGSFARLSGGFMNKLWDATGIERDPEFWKLIYEILLPGGYVFAFSGARTGHWQACAMEVAGFVLHPMHGWVYGSGFPKGHAAGKAIDNALGAVRTEVVGKSSRHNSRPFGEGEGDEIYGAHKGGVPDLYAPATAEAAQWEGWAYGTQTQKPALEPIYLAQKPFSERTGAANLLKHGVGAFNIDGCRVGDGSESQDRSDDPAMDRRYTDDGSTNFAALPGASRNGSPLGRYPSNLILDGSAEVTALFPSGKSGKPGVMRKGRNDGATYGAESRAPGTPMTGYGDEGSNARFFHQFAPSAEDYQWAIDAGEISEDRGDAIVYCAKATKADRAGSEHPTVKPIDGLLRYLVRHITPPGGVVLDPFAGSGTTAEAARREGFDCILMEAEPDYVQFVRERFQMYDLSAIGIYSNTKTLENQALKQPLIERKYADADMSLVDILGDSVLSTHDTPHQPVAQPRSDSSTDLTALLF